MDDDDDIALATLDSPSERRIAVTVEQRVLFLETLAKTGSLQAAAEAAHPGVKPESASKFFRRLTQRDASFAEDVRKAVMRSQAVLETVIYDHAINGWDEPVFYEGEEVGTVRKYDHNLMVKVAKRNGRLLGDDSWEEKKVVEHQGQQTVNHTVSFRDLPKEQRDEILRRRQEAKRIIEAQATERKS